MFPSIQQSYEQRGKVVKDGKEAELWSEVSPEMMSDEEREGEGYVHHQPHYRSLSLNSFIKKLDSTIIFKSIRPPIKKLALFQKTKLIFMNTKNTLMLSNLTKSYKNIHGISEIIPNSHTERIFSIISCGPHALL